MKTLIAVLVVAGVAASLLRRLIARRIERRIALRLPCGPDGVIPGAEAIDLAGGKNAVLILHGFGDTPQSVGALASYLHSQDWTVRVPRLPGHGGSLRQFAASRAAEWIDAVQATYREMRERYPVVAIVGQSMGGALATLIAVGAPDCRVLVLLAPYMVLPPAVAWTARFHRLVRLVAPYVRARTRASIWNPVEQEQSLGFGVTPTPLLGQLAVVTHAAWRAAPQVQVPTLLLQSRQDNRIRAVDARAIFAHLGTAQKELVWLDGCGHVIAVDYCRDQVNRRVAVWLETFGLGGERDVAPARVV